MEPNSKEDAQLLWQRERHNMQDTLRQQKEQMMEDKKWLEKEERLLVGNRTLLFFVSMSIFYKMNLPVLLQDPMAPEDPVSPVVGANANFDFRARLKGHVSQTALGNVAQTKCSDQNSA